MVAIVGRGNVASHLYKALKGKTEARLVNPRTLEDLPENPEIILISVSDNAISEVAEKLPQTDAIIAHTSGSIPMDALKTGKGKRGVVYPLQTFSKNTDLNYSEIPVFIEGEERETREKLKKLAALFTKDVREADSEARKNLHLASVFACNFTNALAGISKHLLSESGIDFSALLPLMKQTVDKLSRLSPEEAQTGPAARGDTKVIEAHLKMLEKEPELYDLYSRLTDYITNHKTNPTT